MWKAIQFAVTGVLALFAIMMQISPKEAQSNLSEWLSIVTDNVPPILKTPAADKWTLVFLAAVALVVWLGPWAYKKWGKSNLAAQSTSGEQSSISPATPKAVRDTKMHLAFAFIETGKWGADFFTLAANPGPKNKGFSHADLRQAALDGDIRVWGRLSPNNPHDLITPQYWRIWHIEWFSCLKGECQTEIAEVGYKGGHKYYDLMVSKAEIEAKWPPKS